MKRISKKTLGMIGTKQCKRCKLYFYPPHKETKLCVYCQGKSYPIKKLKCKVWDCNSLVGIKGGQGLCAKHYSKLIRWPKEKVKNMAENTGFKICKTYLICKKVFKPKSLFDFKRQKYCTNCSKALRKNGGN